MSVQVEISYEQLLKAVQALPPQQKAAFQKELQNRSGETTEENPWAGMSFQELLLNGPVATEEDLQQMAEARRELEAWNTLP